MKKENLYIDVGIRTLFIALYTYTAMMKWFDFPVYRIKMRRQHLPEPLKELFVWGVPLLEMLVVIGMIAPFFIVSPRLAKASMYANLMLIGSFTMYSGLAASGIFGYVPCSCGGVLESLGWDMHFLFNLGLTILAAIGVRLHRKNEDANLFTAVRSF